MKKSFALCIALATSACGVADDATTGDQPLALSEGAADARRAPRRSRVQVGSQLLVLEVTDDDHAIYQDGQELYATALSAGAQRQHIASVPPGNIAFVYRVGKVAFCWTNPDRTKPGFGVSPLTIWSAASGARLASAASPIGTLATAASPDGREVIFPSNGSADGLSGDLELASSDLRRRTTLVSGVQMGFGGAGPCRPLASFLEHGRTAYPVAAYCPGAATTATLSRWQGWGQSDLLSDLAAPPAMALDRDGERIFTILGTARLPVVVGARGRRTIIDNAATRFGFLNPDGAVIYAAGTPTPPFELRRAIAGRPASPQKLVDLQGLLVFVFGSRGLGEPRGSSDGRRLLYFTTRDPATGLTDVAVADTRGGRPPTVLDAQPQNALFGEPFTTDSRYALYATMTDVVRFTGPMYAADESGVRQYSDPRGWSWLAAADGLIAYNDNAVIDPNNIVRSTSDLKVVDPGSRGLRSRLIAPQANIAFFLSHQKAGVVYTTDQAPAGLYVDRLP